MMEVIGKTKCQPIGDCGSGTWGNIKTGVNTVYVDQSYKGGNSDGSQSRPFLTINGALQRASPGDQVAVAAGAYSSPLSISEKVSLEGRCAQMVTITGTTDAVTFWDKADKSTLRGVTITSGGAGLVIRAVQVTVEQVAVVNNEGLGIQVFRTPWTPSTLILRDSLVAGNRGKGIQLLSSNATIDRCVIRDTRERVTNKLYGEGISATTYPGMSFRSVLKLRDSLVAENRVTGIDLRSSDATIERSVIRETRPQAKDQSYGMGIVALVATGQTQGSDLGVLDSLLTGNRRYGIALYSSKAKIERSTIRETLAEALNGKQGLGIQVLKQSDLLGPSTLILQDSLVEKNRSVGVAVASSSVVLERSIVRETRPQEADNQLGQGISATTWGSQTGYPEVTLRDCLITKNRLVGVDLKSASATLVRVVVRGTLEQASDSAGGLGIRASIAAGQTRNSQLTVRNSLVSSNRLGGVSIESSKAQFEQSVIRGSRSHAKDGAGGFGIQVTNAPGQNDGSHTALSNMLIDDNQYMGILLTKSIGTLTRSIVRDTKRDSRGLYGDGVVVSMKSTLSAADSAVEGSARAGFLFHSSDGSVHRCLIRRNTFAIDIEGGAKPTIGTDNQVGENKENEVTSKSLKIPSPSTL